MRWPDNLCDDIWTSTELIIRVLMATSGSHRVVDRRKQLKLGQVFVGRAWAEDHHHVDLVDAVAKRLARARLPEGDEGMSRFHELVAEHV